MQAVTEELLPTRLSLLGRLKEWGDEPSWNEFANLYSGLIYNVAMRAGLDRTSAEDVMQETLLAVAKGLQTFEHDSKRGSFKSWLLTITRRRVSDHLRKLYRQPVCVDVTTDDSATPLHHEIPDERSVDWDKVWQEEWNRTSLEIALQQTRQKVKPLQFQLFDCFVLQQWPMRKVTEALGVSMAQVYFAKYKVSARLRSEIRALEKTLQGPAH